MIRRRELLGIGSAARSSCAWRCLYSPAITLPGAISASRMFAGLRANRFDVRAFKYGRIDPNWRPS